MTVENKNHVFRLQVTSPLGFNLWLSSDARVVPMTLSDYLSINYLKDLIVLMVPNNNSEIRGVSI